MRPSAGSVISEVRLSQTLIVPLRAVIARLTVGANEADLQALHIRPDRSKHLIAKRGIKLPADEHLLSFLPHRLHFRICQHRMVGEFLRTFERCGIVVGPETLQIRMPIRSQMRFIMLHLAKCYQSTKTNNQTKGS